ncbi:MAG: outer membrane beta-barrel protein [Muribaculaceae bacterium]|nr:outer membrane beta-barrel protein [Muribaculaceae bacterium]
MTSLIKKITLTLVAGLAALAVRAQEDVPLINFGPAKQLLTLNAHVGAGNSLISSNLESAFPSITESSLNAGWAFLFGATAEVGLRDYLALGTEVNLLIDNYTGDIIVHREASRQVSNIFLRNHFYAINFPVYLSLKMNLASTVRWNVDAGLYYTYGLGGKQHQTVYNAVVNDLGQQILSSYSTTSNYYNDSRSFINSAHKGDIGLHIASGLTFRDRYILGARARLGLKNIANTVGLIHPNIHNFSFMVVIGYRFF